MIFEPKFKIILKLYKNLNPKKLLKIKRMNRPGTSISKAKVTKISTDDFQHNKVQQ